MLCILEPKIKYNLLAWHANQQKLRPEFWTLVQAGMSIIIDNETASQYIM